MSCASALLDAGCDVLMLDVGTECEPERRERLERLRRLEPDELREQVGDLAPSGLPSEGAGFPLKLAFGSRFPYALDEIAALVQEGTQCVESHARGGLSNVWGAAVLPLRESDTAGWPIDVAALAPHYAAVAGFMPICGGRDALEPAFPYHGGAPGALPLSAQAQAVRDRLERHADELGRRGYLFGQARLAVRAPGGEDGCRTLGLCLSGCPYGAIFNAADVVGRLLAHPRFRYETGVKALRLIDEGGHVRVLAGRDGATVSVLARRVLVAVGAISTIKLVLQSRPESDPDLELRYHPYFLMPLLSAEGAPDVERERLHTLAQLFVEVQDRDVSAEPVHLQLYTFSPQLRQRVRELLAWLGPLRRLPERPLLARLAAFQGYFHSSAAPPIRVRALRRAGSAGVGLRLTAGDLDGFRGGVARLARKLRRDSRLSGLFPVPAAIRIGRPGDGNHVGAVFPMRRVPAAFETDLLGRLGGAGRVHLADASVLPSLPAPTITYTAMANAHRIGVEIARCDAAAAPA